VAKQISGQLPGITFNQNPFHSFEHETYSCRDVLYSYGLLIIRSLWRQLPILCTDQTRCGLSFLRPAVYKSNKLGIVGKALQFWRFF